MDHAVLMKLSDLHESRRNALPKTEYRLMTRENMAQLLKDNDIDPDCVRARARLKRGATSKQI